MAAHLAGAARDMAPDAFRAALGDAIGRGGQPSAADLDTVIVTLVRSRTKSRSASRFSPCGFAA